ncbi:hypothetical protein JXA40_10255 [bacterium]|nr:hypothetical protein [candidate division CSSED10-310 bacterium]
MPVKVLFNWVVPQDLRDYFSGQLDSSVRPIYPENNELETAAELAPKADILVGWRISEPLLNAAVKLKLIIIPAIGVDGQIPILKKYPHIPVANSHGNAVPAAEMAVTLLLASMKWIVHFDRRMRDGKWRAYEDSPPSLTLEGMTVGLLGTGAVGKTIARLLSNYSVTLIGCSRSGDPLRDFPDIEMYSSNRLYDFLPRARGLIVSLPRTGDTEGMIGEHELSLLPDQSVLVNVGRGSVVREEPLYEALLKRKLLGAGLDVWYNYRPEEMDGKRYPYRLPFHRLDNVVLSPHRGASPLLRPERFDDVMENIRRFAAGEPIVNRVVLERGY